MRILFVWSGLTGYMGDCWRALSKLADMKILVDGTGLGKNFKDAVMDGLDWERVGKSDAIRRITAFAPDVIAVVGWHRELPREIAFADALKDVPKLLVMDMPWRRNIRCFAARFVLRRYVRRFRGILVHGASSVRYARWLGFRPQDIHRHCILGINLARFAAPQGNGDRTGFLFVGRNAPEKGIETLRTAYGIYRKNGGTWPLTVPEWTEPEDVPRLMHEHACFILPSKWEPWGVVVAEAKAAGMKVIVSDQVHAREDLACDAVFRAGDADELAAKMLEMERTRPTVMENLDFWSCEAWAKRVVDLVKGLRPEVGG